jgi:hypothetical protein
MSQEPPSSQLTLHSTEEEFHDAEEDLDLPDASFDLDDGLKRLLGLSLSRILQKEANGSLNTSLILP